MVGVEAQRPRPAVGDLDLLLRERRADLLDLAEEFVDLNRQIEKKTTSLRGRTLINMFFEASTRTQASFELAGKRLGADVMNMSVSSSSTTWIAASSALAAPPSMPTSAI